MFSLLFACATILYGEYILTDRSSVLAEVERSGRPEQLRHVRRRAASHLVVGKVRQRVRRFLSSPAHHHAVCRYVARRRRPARVYAAPTGERLYCTVYARSSALTDVCNRWRYVRVDLWVNRQTALPRCPGHSSLVSRRSSSDLWKHPAKVYFWFQRIIGRATQWNAAFAVRMSVRLSVRYALE